MNDPNEDIVNIYANTIDYLDSIIVNNCLNLRTYINLIIDITKNLNDHTIELNHLLDTGIILCMLNNDSRIEYFLKLYSDIINLDAIFLIVFPKIQHFFIIKNVDNNELSMARNRKNKGGGNPNNNNQNNQNNQNKPNNQNNQNNQNKQNNQNNQNNAGVFNYNFCNNLFNKVKDLTFIGYILHWLLDEDDDRQISCNDIKKSVTKEIIDKRNKIIPGYATPNPNQKVVPVQAHYRTITTKDENQEENTNYCKNEKSEQEQHKYQDKNQDKNQDKYQDKNQDKNQDKYQDKNQDKNQDKYQDKNQNFKKIPYNKKDKKQNK
jgi:hypothetical protein